MDNHPVSLSDFLTGRRLFDIPVYQRGYAWMENNLQDLWEDLDDLADTKKHYFGTVLLKDSDSTTNVGLDTFKRFDIIDGQQRITTILIVLREIISQLRTVDELEKYIPEFERDYLKRGGHYKLNLLGRDDDFFHRFVIDDEEFIKTEIGTPSQRRIANAKDFFKKRLEEKKEQNPQKFGEYLKNLKQKIDALQIIEYQVSSDADAIRIFETVNDRGRSLSNLEKTKSFLMHTSYLGFIGEEDSVEIKLRELNKYFSGIYQYYEDIGTSSHISNPSEDDIQRYHFIYYISPSPGRYLDELKRHFRIKLREDHASCVQETLNYAKDLELAFHALKEIAKSGEENNDELGLQLNRIFLVERLANILPVLIASWLKFHSDSSKMIRILRLIEAFTFRVYLTGRHRADTGGSRLNRIAYRIHNPHLNFDDLIDELKEINYDYKHDRAFDQDLRSEEIYSILSSGEIKYLLSEYEIHLRNQSNEPLVVPLEQLTSKEFEVEHIWPVSTDKLNLNEDMIELHSQNLHKLGNLTIASKSWNASMGDKPFDDKVLKYKDSSLRVQRELVDWDCWNPTTIKQREDRIVEFALKRWSVDDV